MVWSDEYSDIAMRWTLAIIDKNGYTYATVSTVSGTTRQLQVVRSSVSYASIKTESLELSVGTSNQSKFYCDRTI